MEHIPPDQVAMVREMYRTRPDARPETQSDRRGRQGASDIWRTMMHELQPMETAPRDGSLFDCVRNRIRYTDCHYDDQGRLVREHSYPSVTTWFLKPMDGWLERPNYLIAPYATNEAGQQYIPGYQE